MRSRVLAGVVLGMAAALCGPLGAVETTQGWKARWISHPTAPLREPAVLHFRRAVRLEAKPEHYVVHVSADNRFILYVNGERVGDGPARGDLAHWRYETYDLAPYLKAGENLVAATVWNFGIYAAEAQITDRTAFVVQGEGAADAGLTTPGSWEVELERGQAAVPRKPEGEWTYMANGPGELVDARKYDWGWNLLGGEKHGDWVTAASPMRESIYPDSATAALAGIRQDNYWELVPDTLPKMEFRPTEAGHVVRAERAEWKVFPAKAVVVPAHGSFHLLLDRGALTTGYPKLTVSGGKGAAIRLTYAEALYDAQHHKGDRDEVGERQAVGFHDDFLPDGGSHRWFEPLWWRTWRYLDIAVTTGDEAVTLEGLTANFTAYPFEEKGRFEGGDAELKNIWEVSWRTARLDAHETYMDTPYYEQLQYIGDTRIQALISYAVAGDDRLARQALDAFDKSRIPAGITQSRYPTSQPQLIPTFSLLWIGMLHDYWMYRPDTAPVVEALPGTRTVLAWFARYEQADGLLREVPYWSFVDWVEKGTIPTYDSKGESCVTSLEYLSALGDAAELEKALGDGYLAGRYAVKATHVREGIYGKCWDAGRGLLADNPDRTSYSQQGNALGVLYDVIPKAEQEAVMRKILPIEPGTTPDGVLSASYYFRFYLSRALEHSGLGEEYLASLRPWRELLPLHFSTWPESPGNTRSDSHAWSAHPAYDLLTVVAGIGPDSPGFGTVKVAPHLGELKQISAVYPHPKGLIEVKLEKRGKGLAGSVILPEGLSGTYVWGGTTEALHPGRNEVGLR